MNDANDFPKGWNEERVRSVISHYEAQSEEEAIAEDEAAYQNADSTMMEIPNGLVNSVRALIAQHAE